MYFYIDSFGNSYGRGAGRLPDKRPCPPGLRDDGTSCWNDAHIAAVPFSLSGVVAIVPPITMTTDAHAGRLTSGSK